MSIDDISTELLLYFMLYGASAMTALVAFHKRMSHIHLHIFVHNFFTSVVSKVEKFFLFLLFAFELYYKNIRKIRLKIIS